MNIDELNKIVADEQEKQKQYAHRVYVCVASGCLSYNSQAVLDAVKEEVEKRGIQDTVEVKGVGCLGLCAAGPLILVDEWYYQKVQPEDAAEIVDSLESGEPIERLHLPSDIPFFTHQKRKVVLENSGYIDPERIEEYIARDGYKALHKVLTSMTPAEVIDVISESGLRGRGGAGFPTGLKWQLMAKNEAPNKYVICNADEGDPGAFMNRSVMESDPQRVIEGMIIAAYATGASQGFVYIRAEYPLAVERLKNAIRQARRQGFLGTNICDTPFQFKLDIRIGAGAFVCGEETALMASIEGRRGQPRPRPPYPAEKGLWNSPTVLNNVGTYSNIAPIIRNGAEWFKQVGAEKSPGTKVFALAGKIKNTGLIEVPLGTPLREIVFEIGGGIKEDKAFKAAQTGGPSGGCIPMSKIDTPVDYENLRALGSIMGSGGLIVMDETSDMVKVARYFMEFCMSESCGKCTPCRVGTPAMHTLLDKIVSGEGTMEDIELLEETADFVRNSSLCGLGQGSPNPVLSTLNFFREEYMTRINHGSAKPAEVVEE